MSFELLIIEVCQMLHALVQIVLSLLLTSLVNHHLIMSYFLPFFCPSSIAAVNVCFSVLILIPILIGLEQYSLVVSVPHFHIFLSYGHIEL